MQSVNFSTKFAPLTMKPERRTMNHAKFPQARLKPLRRFLTLTVMSAFVAQFAVAGGVGTGGGDFMPGTKVQASQVKMALSQVTPTIQARLNFLEFLLGTMNDPTYKSAAQKLFGGSTTVFDILNKVHINDQESGPCFDQRHNPKDASIAASGNASFCISVQEATEKLTTENLFAQLVAISIHELGHLVGLDENEAQAVQRFVLSYGGRGDDILLKSRLYTFHDRLKETSTSLSQLAAASDSTGACAALDNLNYYAANLASELAHDTNLGILLMHPRAWVGGSIFNLRTRFANNYCRVGSAPTAKINLEEVFRSTSPDPSYYHGVILTQVGNGDWSALQETIKEMQQALNQLTTAAAEIESKLNSAVSNVRPTKKTPATGKAPSCYDQGGLKCTLKPGLYEGQLFKVTHDFVLPINSGWTTYMDGQVVPLGSPRLSQDGQSFCMISVASGQDGKKYIPESLKVGVDTARIPATASPFILTEISWYVETVFISSKVGADKLGLVIECGKVRDRKYPFETGDTSLSSIRQHLGNLIQVVND
jgi:hypothetical protein